MGGGEWRALPKEVGCRDQQEDADLPACVRVTFQLVVASSSNVSNLSSSGASIGPR